MDDRYAYERALLHFMLTTRIREGLRVVWAETLRREFFDDLGAEMQCLQGDPAEIAGRLADGHGRGHYRAALNELAQQRTHAWRLFRFSI